MGQPMDQSVHESIPKQDSVYCTEVGHGVTDVATSVSLVRDLEVQFLDCLSQNRTPEQQ